MNETTRTTLLPERSAEVLSNYTLTAREDILALLRTLIDKRASISLYLGNDDVFAITQLISINPAFEELVFDAARDPTINARIPGARTLVFVSTVDHVKVQFATTGAQALVLDGLPAFRVRIPERAMRLQRREFYRVTIPTLKPLACTLAHDENDPPMEARVLDLSCGGLSMFVLRPPVGARIGATISHCVFTLPDEDEIDCAIEIRAVQPERIGTRDGVRLRCRFVDLDGAQMNALQRYVTRVERERLARG